MLETTEVFDALEERCAAGQLEVGPAVWFDIVEDAPLN
jgi:hypothetical protein